MSQTIRSRKGIDITQPGTYTVCAFGASLVIKARHGFDAVRQAMQTFKDDGISLQGRSKEFYISSFTK